ncbi:hypothetical protein OSK38_27660, partial [Escherichia coli]|nr:hypothetical protein [Escherichia coli]
ATNVAAGGTQAIGSFTLTLGASVNVGDEATFSAKSSTFDNTDSSLSLQIGANSSQTMNVSIGDMRAAALNVEDIDVTSSQSSQSATTAINQA